MQLALRLLCLATLISGESTSLRLSNSIAVQDRKSLRSVNSGPVIRHRKLEDYWNENKYQNNNDNNNDESSNDGGSNSYKATALQTTGNMFSMAPNQWSPLQWCIFALMLLSFSTCFFCWCVACVIPRCCGQKGTLMYSAMLVWSFDECLACEKNNSIQWDQTKTNQYPSTVDSRSDWMDAYR